MSDGKSEKALKSAGINEISDLLTIKQKDVAALAKKAGVTVKNLDKWIEIADLMRIKGVGEEYSEALNRIGIDSVKEFRNRNAASTLQKFQEMDKKTPNVLRRLPTEKMISKWITHAKRLPNIDIN